MVLTTHALAGAVIGKNISDPWIIAILSIVFHYIFDAIRHGEYVDTMDSKTALKNTCWKVAVDFSLAVILILVIVHEFDSLTVRNIFIGIFFSVLPDFFTFLYWQTKKKFLKPLYKFHTWCHRLPRKSPKRKWKLKNEIYEIIILSISIILLLF